MAVLVALFVAMASFDLITGGVASADRPSASRPAAAGVRDGLGPLGDSRPSSASSPSSQLPARWQPAC